MPERAGAERRRSSGGRRRVDQAEAGREPDAEPRPLSGPGRPGPRRDPAEALRRQEQQQQCGGGGGRPRSFCGRAERHGQHQPLRRRVCRDPGARGALRGPIREPGSAARLRPRRRPAPEIPRELCGVLISAASVDLLAATATFNNLPLEGENRSRIFIEN